MARALRRPLARLFHRTVPAAMVRGFGATLIAAGVALPWVVALYGGWDLSPEAVVEPDTTRMIPRDAPLEAELADDRPLSVPVEAVDPPVATSIIDTGGDARPGDKPGTKEPNEAPSKTSNPSKKGAPRANIDASSDEIQGYLQSVIFDVTRCATSNELPRQKVTFLVEVEAGTGKVHAELESPLGNAPFASCAEKSIARKRFTKGRKYMTFHGTMRL